jgi:diguanylate cyclase
LEKKDLDIDGLKVVTKKSMAIVNKKDIVYPSSYRVVFSTIAKKNGVDIGSEALHSSEEIDDKVISHILELDKNSSRAIQAIKDKDEAKLQSVLEDAKKLQEQIKSLRQIAYEDALTKTHNRQWLQNNYFYEDSEKFKKDGILVIIDMNDFKQINDTYGHAVGDKVLSVIASRLKRTDKNVVRYGGDEFFVIFDENESTEDIQNIMHIMREVLLKKRFTYSDKSFRVSFSYGIAPFKKDDILEYILKSADEKLYSDKKSIKKRLAS